MPGSRRMESLKLGAEGAVNSKRGLGAAPADIDSGAF